MICAYTVDPDTDTCATFTFHDEDHTLGNSLHYVLMKKYVPRILWYDLLIFDSTTRVSYTPIALNVSNRCFSPAVGFSGYTVPHPSDPKMNVRVQTTGIVVDITMFD